MKTIIKPVQNKHIVVFLEGRRGRHFARCRPTALWVGVLLFLARWVLWRSAAPLQQLPSRRFHRRRDVFQHEGEAALGMHPAPEPADEELICVPKSSLWSSRVTLFLRGFFLLIKCNHGAVNPTGLHLSDDSPPPAAFEWLFCILKLDVNDIHIGYVVIIFWGGGGS